MQQVILNGIELSDLLREVRSIVQSEIATIPKHEKVKQFISIDECAELVGMAKQTVYCLTSSKKIPFIKKNGKLLFDRSEIIAWLQEDRQPVE